MSSDFRPYEVKKFSFICASTDYKVNLHIGDTVTFYIQSSNHVVASLSNRHIYEFNSVREAVRYFTYNDRGLYTFEKKFKHTSFYFNLYESVQLNVLEFIVTENVFPEKTIYSNILKRFQCSNKQIGNIWHNFVRYMVIDQEGMDNDRFLNERFKVTYS